MLYDLPKPKDGEVFCEFNVNPKKILTGDCSIRAIALAFDIPYEKAYRELCDFGIDMSREFNTINAAGTFLNKRAVALRENLQRTGDDFAKNHQTNHLCQRD